MRERRGVEVIPIRYGYERGCGNCFYRVDEEGRESGGGDDSWEKSEWGCEKCRDLDEIGGRDCAYI